jgi:hypothetical protein
MRDGRLEGGGHQVPVSRCVSAAGVRFSVIRFPPGGWAFLTVGLPDTPAGAFRTSTGLPRSARTSRDRGGYPLYPGDGGAHPGRGTCSAGACRSAAASPCTPLQHPTSRGSASRGINEGLRDSPVRSSLACGRPGGTGRPWASPRASHPAVTGDARRGWDRPSSTDLELHAHIRLILQSGSPLVSCDLASHRPEQASRTEIPRGSLPYERG